jgi:hypothetical protein
MAQNLSADAKAAAWVHFACAAMTAYAVPREYPQMDLDTAVAAKRAGLAADEMLAEFLAREFTP